MTLSRTGLVAALSLLAMPAAAEPFRAVNHMYVAPQGSDRFEVSGNAELWARDYWCAAGEYAQRVLGMPVTARIVVAEPYGKTHRAVGFVTDPDAEPQFRVVVMGLSIRSAGSSLSVGQARGFCADHQLRRGH